MLQFDEVEAWPLWVNSFDVNNKICGSSHASSPKKEVFHHDAN